MHIVTTFYILSHSSQLPESRFPCASLAQGSPDGGVQTAILTTSTSHLSPDDKAQKLKDALQGVNFHIAVDALAKSQGDMDQAAGLLIQHGESSEESTMVLAANMVILILLLAVLLPSLESSLSRKR